MSGERDPPDDKASGALFGRASANVRPAPWTLPPGGSGARAWPPGIGGTSEERPPASPPQSETEAPDPEAELAEALGEPELLEPGPCEHCDETRREAARDLEEMAATLMEPYLAAAQSLERATQELTDRFAENVVSLAARMATAILHRDAELDAEPLIANIQRALQVAGPVTRLTLRCHADDADAIRTHAPGLAAEISGRPVEVTVRPSGDVDRGSCIVLFEEGIVDARWQVQIDRISAAVRTAMSPQPMRIPRPPEPPSVDEREEL
ncbi:MAG: hypothetical protein H6744_14010 [Deltaproteobacteria bacterium]|nr:hypothetical protein [Deltaproteobacteria bacterium]MCB9787793.1 hypothetical protein [Deltaproteobacteria bacterium]